MELSRPGLILGNQYQKQRLSLSDALLPEFLCRAHMAGQGGYSQAHRPSRTRDAMPVMVIKRSRMPRRPNRSTVTPRKTQARAAVPLASREHR